MPLALLRTKALVHNDPVTRASWAPHATDSFYIGPANNLHFYIPSTRHFRFADTWRLYPAHCQVPVASEHNKTLLAAANIFKQLGCTIQTMASAKLKHLAAICQLSTIMSDQLNFTHPLPTPPRVETDPPPRVAIAMPTRMATTSNTITMPCTIRWLPFMHQRLTQHNNHFQILTGNDNNNDDNTVIASNCSPPAPLPSQHDHRVPTATSTTTPRPPTQGLQLFLVPNQPLRPPPSVIPLSRPCP